MADRLILKAQQRTEIGSRQAKAVRKAGMLPAIIYGHGEAPVAISLNNHDFVEGLHHGHRLFDVNVGGKNETLLVKDLQYDHLGKEVIHADLIRVNLQERVVVEVALEVKGTPKGAEEGGILDQHLDALEVECMVSAIPENVVINVSELNTGDALYAADLELPAGVKLITDPEALVVNCHVVTEAPTTEEMEEEMPAAPERIGEEEPEPQGDAESGTEAKESSE